MAVYVKLHALKQMSFISG